MAMQARLEAVFLQDPPCLVQAAILAIYEEPGWEGECKG